MLDLPSPITYNEEMRVTLDGITYKFLYRWNERSGHWYLSIYLLDDTPIITGLRIIIGWNLLLNVNNLQKPQGALFFLDLSTNDGLGDPPGSDDLGNRVQGYYL